MTKTKALSPSEYKAAIEEFADTLQTIKRDGDASFSKPDGFSRFLFLATTTRVVVSQMRGVDVTSNLLEIISRCEHPLMFRYPGKDKPGPSGEKLRLEAYERTIQTFFKNMSDGKFYAYRGLNDIEWHGLSRFLQDYKKIRSQRDAEAESRGLSDEGAMTSDFFSLNSLVSINFALGTGGSYDLAKIKTPKRISRSGVLMVAKLSPSDVLSWGQDSESGFLNEAEIFVRPCTPKCLTKIFVVSNEKIGKLASEKSRREFSLDQRRVVRIKEEWDDYSIMISANVAEGHGKVYDNLPSGYDWYEFDV